MWKADFQAEADRWEARRQAETCKLFEELHEEIAREAAQYQEETHNAIDSLKNDMARLASPTTNQQGRIPNNLENTTANENSPLQTSHEASSYTAECTVQERPTQGAIKPLMQQDTRPTASNDAQMNPTRNHDPQRLMSEGEGGGYRPPPRPPDDGRSDPLREPPDGGDHSGKDPQPKPHAGRHNEQQGTLGDPRLSTSHDSKIRESVPTLDLAY